MTCATTYDYRDAGGKFLYGVERRPQKQFRQFRIDEQGKKIWNVAGVPRVPYRLPELLAGISDGEIVVCAEGEKDVDNLSGLGFCVTTNAGGAAWPWTSEFCEHFRGAKIVIVVADNDHAGRKAARDRA